MSTALPISSRMDGLQRILIIDDDRELCELIGDYLRPFSYEVVAEHEGIAGAIRATAEPFHAVLLDLMLPGIDGFEVLRRIRARSDVPVLMLTARGEETDRIVGLELGADDYLPKTFSSRELLARLRAVTRRMQRTEDLPEANEACPAEMKIGPLRVQPSTRTVLLEGHPVKLTALEFDLLASLARACGRVKTREQLLEEIADRLYEGSDRSIDVHVWSLRRKLGEDPKNPRFIHTIRALGYMLVNPEATTPGTPD